MPRVQGKVKALPICVAASVQHPSHHTPGEGVGTGRCHQGPTTPGLFLQESATVREPKQNYAPINKEKLPFPLALDRPISKSSFWAFWSLPSLTLTGSEGSLPWVSDPPKRHRVGSLSSQS